MAPTYSIVCEEFYAARQHLYDLIGSLSVDEMQQAAAPPPYSCISALFACIAVTEDAITGEVSRKTPKETKLATALERYGTTQQATDLPPPPEILDAARRVRDNTVAFLALPFRAVKDEAQAMTLAEPFRRIINTEYAYAAVIAATRRALGKPEAEPPPSKRVTRTDTSYVLDSWESVTPDQQAPMPS